MLRVSPQGKQLPHIKFADRAFSNINFAKDGTIYLGEHLVGNTVRTRPGTSLGTTLPKLPGTDRFGDGRLYQFTQDGKLLKEFPTPVHGGMPGFLGLTGAALRPDGKSILYLSELSDSIRCWDLVNNQALPNLVTYAPDSGNMAMTVMYTRDGKLLHIRANFKAGFFLEHLDENGKVLREYPLPGPGWAAVGQSIEPDTTLIGNFFTGTVAKFSLKTGEIVAKAETGVQRSLRRPRAVPRVGAKWATSALPTALIRQPRRKSEAVVPDAAPTRAGRCRRRSSRSPCSPWTAGP